MANLAFILKTSYNTPNPVSNYTVNMYHNGVLIDFKLTGLTGLYSFPNINGSFQSEPFVEGVFHLKVVMTGQVPFNFSVALKNLDTGITFPDFEITQDAANFNKPLFGQTIFKFDPLSGYVPPLLNQPTPSTCFTGWYIVNSDYFVVGIPQTTPPVSPLLITNLPFAFIRYDPPDLLNLLSYPDILKTPYGMFSKISQSSIVYDSVNNALTFPNFPNCPAKPVPLNVSAGFVMGVDVNTAQFNAVVTSGNPPYNFTWNFNDNTNSNQQNPTHTFVNGNFTVNLLVMDNAGQIYNTNMEVTIPFNPLPGCPPGYHKDPATQLCVSDIINCSPGFHKDTSGNCIPNSTGSGGNLLLIGAGILAAIAIALGLKKGKK